MPARRCRRQLAAIIMVVLSAFALAATAEARILVVPVPRPAPAPPPPVRPAPPPALWMPPPVVQPLHPPRPPKPLCHTNANVCPLTPRVLLGGRCTCDTPGGPVQGRAVIPPSHDATGRRLPEPS